jgi:ABC-type transport system involved in multi-copper enzyme maturation permease subunit
VSALGATLRPIIEQEVLKITRRRGLALPALFVPLGAVVLMLITAVIPGTDVGKGKEFLSDTSVLLSILVFIFAALIGARVGADDFHQGTFRYMAMTGQPLGRLYVGKAIAVVLLVAASLAPAVVLATLIALIMPNGHFEAASAHDVFAFAWSLALYDWVFGLIAFSVGALLRSNGAAIAVAMALNLGGFSLIQALGGIAEFFEQIALPNALQRLSTGPLDDTTLSVGAAIVVVFCWVGALMLAGAQRTRRGEY